MTTNRSVNLPSAAMLVLGLWLIAAPWTVGAGVSQAGRVSVIVAGILVALLAAGNIWGKTPSRMLSWLIAALGAWTVATPFFFGDAVIPAWTWSCVLAGVLIGAFAIVEAATSPVAEIEQEWGGAPIGPWTAGRYLPGLSFEIEEQLLGLLRDARQRAGVMGDFRGVGPRGWLRPDAQILDEVCGRMADHPWLDARDIDVTVANGEVTLRGNVLSRAARRLAEDIAERVRGVRDVINQLRVRDRESDIRKAA